MRVERGLSPQRVQAGRDTWSLAFALGEVIFQWAIVQRLLAGALEPGHVIDVFHALQEFFVVLDWDNDGDGFAFARHDFRFGPRCFHTSKLPDGWFWVNLESAPDFPGFISKASRDK